LALLLAMILSGAFETRSNAFTPNSTGSVDRWAVVEDSHGDGMQVWTSNDTVWAELVQMYHDGSRRWVGGIVEMYNNQWGFRFNSSTILVADQVIEVWQTTIRQLSQDMSYWLGRMACVAAIIVAINPVRVPQDYISIQEAINHAVNNGTVLVAAGTYFEHVVVNKTVSLVGESANATIIHGVGNLPVVLVSAGNVTVKDFVLQYGYRGILIQSSYNNVSGNTLGKNTCGIELSSSSSNRIYHNNFIDNKYQALVSSDSLNNVWDDGYPSGGNYWINYTGVDANGDGIGDSPYVIDANNRDNFPLMTPYPYYSGDINRDGVVNSKDLILFSQAYGSTPSSPKWNPNADMNNDKVIDIRDLKIISKNYGKTIKP
jgi:parallel beta-helix repeat protein